MTCRLLRLAMAASLVTLPPTAAAARKPAKGDLNSNLARVSSFCEQAVLRAPGTGFPIDSPRGIDIHVGARLDGRVPDLVKRFAARQAAAPLVSSPSFQLHFLAPGGDVWALVYDRLPICNVMVTGASADMSTAASRLANTLGGEGWQIAGSIPATPDRPLSKHVLVKKIAKPGVPDFGLMLTIRALAGAADPTGIQLEMELLAGEVENSPESSDVKVKISLPAGGAGTSPANPQ